MPRFRRDTRTTVNVGPADAYINLLTPPTSWAYHLAESTFVTAFKVMNAESFDQIRELVENDMYLLHLDMDTFDVLEKKGDIKRLKERLIVNFYCYCLHKHYIKEVRRRGRKGDRLQNFFNEVTPEPINAWELADKHALEYTTIKNHRRFDPYPDRGITKIKNKKIFRQPVDGKNNIFIPISTAADRTVIAATP